MHQAAIALGLITLPKPLHLAVTDPQQLGRPSQTKLPSPNLRQHHQPFPLPTIHRNRLHTKPSFGRAAWGHFYWSLAGTFLMAHDTARNGTVAALSWPLYIARFRFLNTPRDRDTRRSGEASACFAF